MKHDEDLIAVRPKAKSPVRGFFESSMWAVGRFPPIFQRTPRDPLIIDGSTVRIGMMMRRLRLLHHSV
jgi:hypothetical protein